MENKKQTAVEYLEEQLKYTQKEAYNDLYEVIEQAKQMEKQQIMDAFYNGDISIWNENSEQYYNETFKK